MLKQTYRPQISVYYDSRNNEDVSYHCGHDNQAKHNCKTQQQRRIPWEWIPKQLHYLRQNRSAFRFYS